MAQSIIRDVELSNGAVRVYCELVLWTVKGSISISRGQRAIGEAIGMHQETVGSCLKELATRKHIRIEGEGQARRRYTLLSPVYRKAFTGEAGGQVVEYTDDGEVIHKRLVKERKAS